jgi:hypothetical protein
MPRIRSAVDTTRYPTPTAHAAAGSRTVVPVAANPAIPAATHHQGTH